MAEEVVPNGGAVTDSATTSAATTSAATSAAPTSSAAATSSGAATSATTSAVASSSTTSAATSSGTTSATSATTSATAVDYGKAIKDAIPEGFTFDEKVAGTTAEVFAKHNIPQEAIADLIKLHAAQIKAGTDGNAAAFQAQVQAWKTASEADKEIGAENLGIAKTAMSKVFDAKTMETLELFGLTNHPVFIKGFVKIGKAIKDDSWVPGNAGPTNGARDARAHFPNSDMNA